MSVRFSFHFICKVASQTPSFNFSVRITLSFSPSESGVADWRRTTISHHWKVFHNHLEENLDMNTSLRRRALAMIISVYLWLFSQLVIYLTFPTKSFLWLIFKIWNDFLSNKCFVLKDTLMSFWFGSHVRNYSFLVVVFLGWTWKAEFLTAFGEVGI